MTDIDFTYADFEQARVRLISVVNSLMTPADKEFLLSFENAEPDWKHFDFEYFRNYPSVNWKLQNLMRLMTKNPSKLKEEAAKLEKIFH